MNPVSNLAGSAAASPAVNFFANLAGAGTAGGTAAADAAANASQDRFMTLLVAQMKNQDPLNPMDNAQVTSQIAQINTVKGIDQLNQTVQKLLGNADAAQSMQAAALIGHTALVAGKSIELIAGVNGTSGTNGNGGTSAASGTGGFSLAAAAEDVTLTISAASGQVVHRTQLGGLGAGLHHFTWDGKTDAGAAAQPGAYTFAVTARSGGSDAAAETLSALRIDGVTPGAAGAGGPALQLRGALPVQMNQVRQFF